MWLFEFKFIKIKIQFLNPISHISSVQQPNVANGSHIGQSRHRTFPSPQKVIFYSTNGKFSVNHKYYRHAMLTSLTTFLGRKILFFRLLTNTINHSSKNPKID